MGVIRSRRLQNGSHVLHDLLGLGLDPFRLHPAACRIDGDLAGSEQEISGGNRLRIGSDRRRGFLCRNLL